jgi:hypothetical protein
MSTLYQWESKYQKGQRLLDFCVDLTLLFHALAHRSYTSVVPLLEKLDKEGKKIISFASWRAWPRRTHIKYVLGAWLYGRSVVSNHNNTFSSLYLFQQPRRNHF